jgi:DNA-binding response OmpR family regulator
MNKKLGESVQTQDPARGPKALRVLIVDDDQDSVLMLMMLIRAEGHAVRGIYAGRKVMEAVAGFDPDVVLLDIQMPDISGWEVARTLRKERGDKRPLLIGISGEYKMGSDRILSQILGFDHYLIKPYEFSEVLRLLAPLTLPGTDQKRA